MKSIYLNPDAEAIEAACLDMIARPEAYAARPVRHVPLYVSESSLDESVNLGSDGDPVDAFEAMSRIADLTPSDRVALVCEFAGDLA